MAHKNTKSDKRLIAQYSHADKKRVNNPPVGLVAPDTDLAETNRIYAYDPHIAPSLLWAGKAERTSFDVPTVPTSSELDSSVSRRRLNVENVCRATMSPSTGGMT